MSNPTNNGPTNKSLWDNDRRYDTARRAGAPSMANTPSARSLAPQVSNTNTTPQTPPGADSNNSSGGKRKKKRKLKKRRILLAILMLFVFLFVVGGVSTAAYVAYVLKDLPDWDETMLSSDKTTFLYDANGQIFSELHSHENRTYVKLSDMPDYLIDCLLATEDTRFYKHHGVDVIRIGGALLVDIRKMDFSQGASTLTMQLARTAILDDRDKNIDRKIKEAALAIQLENEYSKDDILAMYLNEVYFGHSAYGVQAASQTLFGKDVGEISMAEAATLVGIVRNPRLYSPILNPENSERVKRQVLTNLSNYYGDKYSAADIAAAKEEVVQTGESAYETAYNYPWYTDYVIDCGEDILSSLGYASSSIYTGGYRIYTTLNPQVQGLMETAFADSENFPSTNSDDIVESAMVVLSTQNNSILGLVGGREYTTKRGYNRATDMKRQPGSTFKPIADYAPAIEAGYAPATVVNDVRTTFGTNWQPVNYDGKYRGIISMRTAAQNSVNVASIKFLQLATIPNSLAMLAKMGIELDPEKDNNLSIALGGITYGVSPLQMAAAYGTLANGGVYTQPWCITRIEDSQNKVIYENELAQTIAMKETTAYLVTDMLRTVTTSGTGTRAQLPNRDVASKTGTVQLPDLSYFKGLNGNRDAWFAAYSPEMVGVVWMGYDNDKDANGKVQYLRQIYGGKYPALIWKYVIGGASTDLPESRFKRPAGIVSVTVDAKTGMLPSEHTTQTVTELFDKDNVPTSSAETVYSALVCSETNLLASEFCPETETLYKIPEPDESNNTSSSTLPTEYCTVHTMPPDLIDIYNPEENNNTPDVNIGNGDNNSNSNIETPPSSSNQTLTAPSNVSASKRNNTNAYVSWTNSNSGNVKYQVEYWTEGGKHQTITTYFTDLTVSNLSANQTYNFRVRALTDAEDAYSPWSGTCTVSL